MPRFKLDPDKKVVHHICYDYNGSSHKQEEITKVVYYAEHHILTQLQRRGKRISKGFLDHLKYFIWKTEVTGFYEDLDENDKKLAETGAITEGTIYDVIKEARAHKGLK